MAETQYSKTDAGRSEIEQRSRKLPANMRSILLMVDGQRSASELAALIDSLRAPADTLEQLQAQGLIEARVPAEDVVADVVVTAPAVPTTPSADASPAATERYTALYNLTSEAIRAHLGLKGYFLQLKVERCSTAEQLEALLPDVAEALAKAKSDALGRRLLADASVAGLGTTPA